MKIKNFISCVTRLSTVKRFSQSTLCNPESVLEHTGGAALICMFIGNGLIGEGYKINMGVLLQKALLHDFDEIASGDIARPVKYHSQEMRDLFHEFELQNMKQICEDFTGSDLNAFLSIWGNAKEGVEGQIVAIADLICVIYKIHNEIVMRGNCTMYYYFDQSYFKKVWEKFLALDRSVQILNIENQEIQTNNFASQFLHSCHQGVVSILAEIRGHN